MLVAEFSESSRPPMFIHKSAKSLRHLTTANLCIILASCGDVNIYRSSQVGMYKAVLGRALMLNVGTLAGFSSINSMRDCPEQIRPEHVCTPVRHPAEYFSPSRDKIVFNIARIPECAAAEGHLRVWLALEDPVSILKDPDLTDDQFNEISNANPIKYSDDESYFRTLYPKSRRAFDAIKNIRDVSINCQSGTITVDLKTPIK